MAEENIKDSVSYNTQKNIKNDVEDIKSDMYRLAQRIGALKGHSYDAFCELTDSWGSVMGKYKDQVIDQGKEGVDAVSRYVHRNPWGCIIGTGLLVLALSRTCCRR